MTIPSPLQSAPPNLSRDRMTYARPVTRSGPSAALQKIFSAPVVLSSFLVATIFFAIRLNPPDPDTWWHAVVGRQILATHAWPTLDAYAFTVHGFASIAPEWLGEMLIGVAARWGSLSGFAAVTLVMGGTLVVAIFYYSYLCVPNPLAAFVACVLLSPLMAVSTQLGPQLLGYIFFAAALICLEHFRRGRQFALWLLPALFLIWINTDRTFIFGLLAYAVFWVSGILSFPFAGLSNEHWSMRQRLQLAAVALLSVLTLRMTPYGASLFTNAVVDVFRQPPNFLNLTIG